MPARIAILGRPNVGKSTLFNRLAGRRIALVDDTPGVTRDRIEVEATLGARPVTLIDTAGLEDGSGDSLPARLRRLSEAALSGADLGLFVIDGKLGPNAADLDLAAWLRRQDKPVLLVSNKSDAPRDAHAAQEAWALGLGAPIPVSALHAVGVGELEDAILAALPAEAQDVATAEDAEDDAFADEIIDEGEDADAEEEAPHGPLKIVILGRPNAGKSSLVNRLLQEERMLTGPEPGLTRDAVPTLWTYRAQAVELIDTAGLRKKARIERGLDKMSTSATIEALKKAHVAVLMIDATQPLEQQDAAIADLVVREGRALVVALNKWDLVTEQKETLALVRHRLEHRLPQIKGVICHTMSLKTGYGAAKLLPAVLTAYERWNRRVSTAKINRWLMDATATHQPPLVQGRRVKLRYGTQIKARPPTFVLFGNKGDALPDSYKRYLVNGLRATFDLNGVPIRLKLRRGENPYA